MFVHNLCHQTAMHTHTREVRPQDSAHIAIVKLDPHAKPTQSCNTAVATTKPAKGCHNGADIAKLYTLELRETMKHAIHTSRVPPTDIQCCRRCLMRGPSKLMTAWVSMKSQLLQAQYFYPARDGGREPIFLPRPGWRARPGQHRKSQRDKRTGDHKDPHGETERTTTKRSHGGPRRAEPTEDGMSSGEAGHA